MSVGVSRSDRFIVAACVPRHDHASGTLEDAEAIRGAQPHVAEDDIYAAAVLGNFAEWSGCSGATFGERRQPAGRTAGIP